MRHIATVELAAALMVLVVGAAPGAPTQGDSAVVALWHFDEPTGYFVGDSSAYGNVGTAYGTTVIAGVQGKARLFNGIGDYVFIGDPSNGSLDFGTNQSFTIEVSFRTTSLALQELVRKGIAPIPGYAVQMTDGKVLGSIGGNLTGPAPDTILSVTSSQRYNDGQWHRLTFIRDRVQRKLFLYVDSILAAMPVNDTYVLSIANDRPLTIGRWENPNYPCYFTGTMDEIVVAREARHYGQDLVVSPAALNFGGVTVGDSAHLTFTMSNLNGLDSVHIASIESSNPRFTHNGAASVLPPGGSQVVQVTYSPSAQTTDTGSISISTNFSRDLPLTIHLSGRGFQPAEEPQIVSVSDILGDQGREVRVRWIATIYDGLLYSLRASQYGLWRRVDDVGNLLPGGNRPTTGLVEVQGKTYMVSNNVLWDFIASIPAVRFGQYAYVAPTLHDSSKSGIHWSVFAVTAHMATGEFFVSSPDSGYSVNNSLLVLLETQESGVQPVSVCLFQNYPNPFNPSTIISFSLPQRSQVTLTVYNTLGQQVATLFEGDKEAGYHNVQFDGSGLSSGVYFYRLTAGSFVQTRRLLLLH